MNTRVHIVDSPAPPTTTVDPAMSRATGMPTVRPMLGSRKPAGRMRCFQCRAEFQAGEIWLLMTPADGSYAIGLHIHCYLASP